MILSIVFTELTPSSQPGNGPGCREWDKRWIAVFSSGPSRPSSLGPMGELEKPRAGTGWGLCPAGLQNPLHNNQLAWSRPWSSSKPLPHLCLHNLMATAVSIGCGPQDQTCLGPREPEDWWELDAWLLQWWQLGRVWGPSHEAITSGDMPLPPCLCTGGRTQTVCSMKTPRQC